MEIDMFLKLTTLHWRLDNGQVSTRGRPCPRTSICFDVWPSYHHHSIILIKITVSFKRLLLDKVNHRNQLEHDNKQFQSEKVRNEKVRPCKCYMWRRHEIILKLPLITILFHEMMKYKMFVNKARYNSATLSMLHVEETWDHTETSFW